MAPPAAASPKAPPPEEKEGFFSGAMSALASAEHAMEAAIVDGAHKVADGASSLAHEAAHLAGADKREPLTDADGILAAILPDLYTAGCKLRANAIVNVWRNICVVTELRSVELDDNDVDAQAERVVGKESLEDVVFCPLNVQA